MLIGWVGGKTRLSRQIISIFPEHTRYIEPFFGSGSVFFNKNKVKENLINDINGDLTNLYEVVRDYPQELIRLTKYTINSESQFNRFYELYYNEKEKYKSLSPSMRALIYFYLIKNSFNNLGKTYSIYGSSWNNDGLLETIEKVSNKLSGTTITSRDYKEALIQSNSSTLAYIDPPYIITIKDKSYYYEYTLTEEEHCNLRDILVSNETNYKWVLSYDIHPLVDKLYSNLNNIFINKTVEVFQSSINKSKRQLKENGYNNSFKQEYIITNYPIINSAPLFSEL